MGVTESGDHDDPSSVVIVPSRPGPLESLGGSERNRDEVDELLDDMFGEPDERGPGVADAVLVVGGAGAVVGGLAASLPGVVVVDRHSSPRGWPVASRCVSTTKPSPSWWLPTCA